MISETAARPFQMPSRSHSPRTPGPNSLICAPTQAHRLDSIVFSRETALLSVLHLHPRPEWLVSRGSQVSADGRQGNITQELLNELTVGRANPVTMIRYTEIAFTAYPVTNMPRARKFYEDVLCLKPTREFSENFVEYDIGPGTLVVACSPELW